MTACVLDFETVDPLLTKFGSGWRHKGWLKIVGCGIHWEDEEIGTWYDRVEDIIEQANKATTIICHNVQYDCGILTMLGVDLRNKLIIDTINIAHLHNPLERSFHLADLAKKYLKDHKTQGSLGELVAKHGLYHDSAGTKKNIKDLGTLTKFAYTILDKLYELEPKVISDYCLQDCNLTWQLLRKLGPKTRMNEASLQWIEVLSNVNKQYILMAKNGVCVSLTQLENNRKELMTEEIRLVQELFEALGIEDGSPEDLNSKKKLPLYFDKLGIKYPYTAPTSRFPNGQPSIKSKWLERQLHPFCLKLKEYRLTNYYRRDCERILEYKEAYKLVPDENNTIRVHPTYKPLAAQTGRASANNPNIKNVPKHSVFGPKMRSMYVASKGHSIMCCDERQQELRIFAGLCHLLGLSRLHDIYKKDPEVDFHTYVAENITMLPREVTKAINFGVMYGEGLNLLAFNLNKHIEEAKPILNQYHEEFFEVKTAMKALEHVYRKEGRGYILIDGRKLLVDSPYYDKEKDRDISFYFRLLNYYNQGRGANQIYFAMSELYKAGITPLMEIYDELSFELDNSVDNTEKVEYIKRVMTTCLKIDIPMLIDIEYGSNWADAKPK